MISTVFIVSSAVVEHSHKFVLSHAFFMNNYIALYEETRWYPLTQLWERIGSGTFETVRPDRSHTQNRIVLRH